MAKLLFVATTDGVFMARASGSGWSGAEKALSGGHEGIMQGDLGVAFSVLGKLTKDVLNRAQQGIGTEMFAHVGNHHAHCNPPQKMDPLLS